MDEYDLVRSIKDMMRKTTSQTMAEDPGRMSQMSAVAIEDSDGGSVRVQMDGTVMAAGGEAGVVLPTGVDVRKGDVVTVTVSGGRPSVSSVIGGGDRTRADINEALSQSQAAQKAASEAQDAAKASQTASESAQKAASETAQSVDASIATVTTEYATSTSPATAPESGWSTDQPTWSDGTYVWWRTQTTTKGGIVSTSAAACVTGAKGEPGDPGDTGTGVSALVAQYYLSTSKSAQKGGEWSQTMPTWEAGHWIWTRQEVTWTDGSVTHTDPVLASAINAANESAQSAADMAVAMASHLWVDSSGQVHVSTQAKPESGDDDLGRHLLLTAAGIALSYGALPLVDMTGGTSGRVDVYDAAGKRRLSVTADGVVTWDADGTTATATFAADSTLGKAAGKHIVLSGSNGIALMDGDTVVSSFTASAAIVGPADGTHVAVTSSGIQLLDGETVIASFDSDSIDFGDYGQVIKFGNQMMIYGASGAFLRAGGRDDDCGVGVISKDGSSQAIMRAASYEIAGKTLTHADLGARVTAPYVDQVGSAVDGGRTTWRYEHWSNGRTHAHCRSTESTWAITSSYGALYYAPAGTWSVAGDVPGTSITSITLQPVSATGLLSASVNTIDGRNFSFFLFDALAETLRGVSIVCDVWLED